jgi:hypothetical protein
LVDRVVYWLKKHSGGGQGWTGSTTCASGSTCVYSNPYYSQVSPPISYQSRQTHLTLLTVLAGSGNNDGFHLDDHSYYFDHCHYVYIRWFEPYEHRGAASTGWL